MASRDTIMRIRLTGDAAGAAKAFRDVAVEMARTDARYKNVADAFIRESERIEAKAKQTSDVVEAQQRRWGGDNVRGAATGRLDSLAGRLPGGDLLGDLGGVEAALGGVSTKAVAAGAAVAALAVVTAKVGQVSVQSFTTLADEVQQFAQLTNTSAEEASGWALALRASGIETEMWVDRVRQFQTNMAQFTERFSQFGIEVERNADGTVDAMGSMMNALERLHSTPDVLERQRIGFQLFGESWTQLMPIIRDPEAFNAWREHFEGTFDQAKLDTLNRFKMSTGLLSTELQVLGAEVGERIVPALVVMADAAGWVVDKVSDLADKAGGFVETWASAVSAGLSIIPGAGFVLGEAVEFAGQKMVEAGAAVGAMHDDMAAAARTAEELAKAEEQAASAAEELRDAYTAVRPAREAVASATARVAEAEAAASESIEAANERAASTIASAADRVQSAKESWADAVASAAKAEEDAARRIADVERQAARSIEQAQERVADARETAAEAAQDLAEAQVDAHQVVVDAAEDGAERVVAAQRRVDDARERAARNAQDNARKIEDADAALADALNRALLEENPFEAQRIREEALRKRERVNEDVAESERDAAERVREAEQGLADAHVEAEERRVEASERAAEIIEGARRRVVDANGRVDEAERSLAETVEEAGRRRADAHRQAADQVASAHGRVASAAAAVQTAEANLATATQQAEEARAKAHEDAAARVKAARDAEREALDLLTAAQARHNQALVALQLIRAAESIQDPVNRANAAIGAVEIPGASFTVPGRASGGRVDAGGMYLVGEDGPEVLQMGGQGGWVHPNGAVGGNTYIIQGSVISERELVEIIARAERGGYGR